MGNMVWTVIDSQTAQPIPNAEVSGNYSSGPSSGTPTWLGGCSSGPGSPVEGYTNSQGQYVVGIPYTCSGGNYTVTVKATGYNDQSVTTPLGAITGDVYRTVQMTKSSIAPPPGQGFGAGFTSILNTGGQAYGEYIILIVVAIAIVIATVYFAGRAT